MVVVRVDNFGGCKGIWVVLIYINVCFDLGFWDYLNFVVIEFYCLISLVIF